MKTIWGVLLLSAMLAACDSGDRATETMPWGTTQPLPPLQTDQVIVAHRGASGHAPEHTFAAYDLAMRMGADYLEIDLLPTADNELVAIHDDRLDRTARGPSEHCTGRVSSKTLEQLQHCDFGIWFNERHPDKASADYVGQKIPTLDAIFQRYGKHANYYIEIKPNLALQGSVEQALLELIKTHGLYEGMVERRQVLVQSFVPTSLLTMWTLDPQVPLVQLMFAGSQALVITSALYSFGIGPPASEVTPALINTARALGLAVHPYTVNRETDLMAMAELCVDGIFTDYPDRYRSILAENALDCPPAKR